MTSIALAIGLATAQGPLQGQALLDDMSQRAVQFFVNESHPATGFTKDRASNFGTDNFSVASVASTGFALSAYAIGAERGWIPRATALTKTRNTVFALRNLAARHRGWFYHFIDWQTGVRVWNSELSSIDTSILLAGMIAADEYFNDPTLRAQVKGIISEINWQWMLTDGGARPNELNVGHGWRPESGFITNRWDNYSEQLILMLQYLGAWDACPTAVWTSPVRERFTYSNIELLTGGPLFIHQMSHGFVDFDKRRDRMGYDYWVATRRATMANRRYCITNPRGFSGYGSQFWGLTASDGPDGYGAFGAPIWGDDNGTVAPTTVAASIEFLTAECQLTLNTMRTQHANAYGRYGFSNGINPSRNWVGPDVIGIDLGMAMCAIENFRDGFVHKQSEKSQIIQRGLRRAGFVTGRVPSAQSNVLFSPR